MNIVIWIVTVALALMFLMAGGMKVTQPKEKLAAGGMKWVEGFSPNTIKLIGGLEVLAAIGLILPAVTDIAPILVPLAATGLVLTMIGAIVTHVRIGEGNKIGMNVVLLVAALFVAIMRFGPYSF